MKNRRKHAPQKRPPHLRPRPPSLFASRTSSGRPPNGAPTPQGYPLTAWSALLLPTTSPAAAIACTANDHGQDHPRGAGKSRPPPRPHPAGGSPPPDRKQHCPRRPPDSYRITTRQPPAPGDPPAPALPGRIGKGGLGVSGAKPRASPVRPRGRSVVSPSDRSTPPAGVRPPPNGRLPPPPSVGQYSAVPPFQGSIRALAPPRASPGRHARESAQRNSRSPGLCSPGG